MKFILPSVIKNFLFEEVIWRNQLNKVQFDSSYMKMWSSLLKIFKVSFMIKKKFLNYILKIIKQSWIHETSVKDLTYVLFVDSTCYTFLFLMLCCSRIQTFKPSQTSLIEYFCKKMFFKIFLNVRLGSLRKSLVVQLC